MCKVIESLAEYVESINALKQNYYISLDYTLMTKNEIMNAYIPKFIFRGHSDDKNFELLPGALRWKTCGLQSKTRAYPNTEINMLNDFISDACRYITQSPTNDYRAWLEIAQHFGVPTRLLDFTTNPLVALYFACIENSDKDASVWIVNESAYRRVFYDIIDPIDIIESNRMIEKIIDQTILNPYEESIEINQIQYPWIFKPFCGEERMASQSSVFMLWGKKRDAFLEFVKPENYMVWDIDVNNKEKALICKIVIKSSMKSKIIRELDLCGVNEKFIFPGLDGIGKYIKRKYTNMLDDLLCFNQ